MEGMPPMSLSEDEMGVKLIIIIFWPFYSKFTYAKMHKFLLVVDLRRIRVALCLWQSLFLYAPIKHAVHVWPQIVNEWLKNNSERIKVMKV